MDSLLPASRMIADRLKARGETVAVAESSAAGLISAALLAVRRDWRARRATLAT